MRLSPQAGRLGIIGPNRVGLSSRGIVTGGITDPNFANVKLLLDFAGADQATNITDLSSSGHVDTFVGAAEVDTAQKFLATNSLLQPGGAGTDRVTFPGHADFTFGTGNFTVECGVRFTAVGNAGFVSAYDGSAGFWFFYSGGLMQMYEGNSQKKTEAWTPSTDTWYHVAVCREGTNLRMFLDGTQLGTPTTDSTSFTTGTDSLNIGSADASVYVLNGNLAAVRITKGVARYTANFTAPTEFYPTS